MSLTKKVQANTKDFEDLCGVDPLVNIFKELVSFDTKADPASKTVPSSVGQLRFGAYLVSCINEIGFPVIQDKKGVVTVTVPASEGCEKAKRLCLLAHMDTAPDCSGANINPHLVKSYQGGEIELKNGLVLNDAICPNLNNHIGEDIIVTDGSTLLGADDKAGISILLHLLHNLKVNPEIKHGPLKIVFSVDEEIGLSFTHLDVSSIDCDYGVTVDGTALGEFDTATFNAYGATVKFKGLSVHTAVAYKTLKNAITMADDFMQMLPRDEKPENTRDEEGFYHIHKIEGTTESARINMIIRDFSKEGMQKRLDYLKSTVAFLEQKYGQGSVELDIKFQYANMEKVLKDNQDFLDICRAAFKDARVQVIENKVRGGTDGSNLSNAGLPTPNIFTGGLNCHGPYECLPVGAFNKAYSVISALVQRLSSVDR
ncbi:MAG: peptidase T [Succinivibrio sp.]